MTLTARYEDSEAHLSGLVRVYQEDGFSHESSEILRAVSDERKWYPKERCWVYPYTLGVVVGLSEAAKMLHLPLRLDDYLQQVLDACTAETERELALRKIVQTYIDNPKLELDPFPTSDSPPPWRHQAIAWHWCMRCSNVYLNHKMGLGKTREGCDIIQGKIDNGLVQDPEWLELPDRVGRALGRNLPARWGIRGGILITCPRAVMVEWISQLYQWQGIVAVPIVGSSAEQKRRRAGTLAMVHVCSYDSLESVEDNQYDGIVADEMHSIANEDSNRFQRLFSLRKSAHWVVGLSGTPQTNGLKSLWSQYYFLDFGRTLCSSFDAFITKFFKGPDGKYLPEHNAEEAITKAISRISWPLTMTQAFPGEDKKKINQSVWVEMTQEQARYYEMVRTEAVADILAGRLTLGEGNSLPRLNKLLQISQGFVLDDEKEIQRFSSAKLAALEEMLREGGDLSDRKVLVWTAFRAEHQRICEMLEKHKIPYLALKGNMGKEKETVRDTWNTDPEKRVLVGMITMGIGLNLHAPKCVDAQGNPRRCSATVFMGYDWRVTVLEQAMDRVYRGDQVETCIYRYLLCEPYTVEKGHEIQPIDTRVHSLLIDKIERAIRVDENSVEYIRSLLAA